MNHSDFNEKDSLPPKPSNNTFKLACGSLDFEQPDINRETTLNVKCEQALSIEGETDIFDDNL